MRLVFLHQPVADLDAAVAFHRDVLGWEEAWREGDDTVAFATPGGVVQVMLVRTDQPAGPMYQVDDLAGWTRDHAEIEVLVPAYEIPGGSVAGFSGAGGNAFYVFDLPGS